MYINENSSQMTLEGFYAPFAERLSSETVRGEALVRKQMGEAQPKNALGQNRRRVSQKYRSQKRQTGDILADRIRRVLHSICREHHG